MIGSDQPRILTLTPPKFREADDGGLGYDDIVADPTRSITAQVGPWGRLIAGDAIEILWGPEFESIARHIVRDEDDRTPLIAVPVSRIRKAGEGLMEVAARITTVDSGEVEQSESATVRVKYSVPGGLDPDPATPYLNERLAKPAIEPLPLPDSLEGITVVVPPYENMAVGDVINVLWQGSSASRPGLSGDEVGQPVRIEISRDTAAATAGEEITIRYEIHDVVANWSRWSQAAKHDVPPDESSSPSAPWVLGTVGDSGNALDLNQVGAADVVVRVENHPVLVGDRISVVWSGVTAAGKTRQYVTEPLAVARPGQTLDFPIPNAYVIELAGGQATVEYRFVSAGKQISSRRRALSILGVAPSLPPPELREAIGHTLDPKSTVGGAHVDVKPWPGMSPEDRCDLEWVGRRADGQPTYFRSALTGADLEEGDALTFVVPEDEVDRLAGGTLRVRYSVALHTLVRSEGAVTMSPIAQLPSPWLELSVTALTPDLSIDSTPATLSGNMIRLEKPLAFPPPGTFLSRVATGGVPPYRYSVSSGAVDVDEATGQVVSLRNGDAIVTVTDVRGQTASYPITVSNVLHLVDLGSVDLWHEANRKTTARNGRTPSPADWDAMRAAYGGAPGVRADAAWTSQVTRLLFPKQQMRVVVFPNTGERQTRRAEGLGGPLQSAAVWMVFVPQA
ncbi:hypothetical protein FIV34_09140 [Luteibacter pinisoli]|uniref:BIG2 domain-containing protein n=1 Tax=Luteibacter pinisoli TaxID=2589080 RepID=A0A4Y5Z395_9GAMM|nr:hypothetical protein [Luteibacter pinisoli]QDE39356.1 hypothetical protein FIV34_09140 [Luteibacter pinisoli]